MYKIELNNKLVAIDELLKYYNRDKVEGYCANCKNYNKIWSCPPHSIDSYDYLANYNYAQIISAKIIFNQNKIKGDYKEAIIQIFQEARIKFGDYLMSLENNSEALIAGNCYNCNKCKRALNEACIMKCKRRYSMESLGLIVSEVTKNILDQEIQWKKNEMPEYYLTVGALLLKEKKPISDLKL